MKTYQVRRFFAAIVPIAVFGWAEARTDIKNWQSWETIPGTDRITPRPGINLSDWNTDSRNLRSVDFSAGLDLSGSAFNSTLLNDARFTGANPTSTYLFSSTLTNIVPFAPERKPKHEPTTTKPHSIL